MFRRKTKSRNTLIIVVATLVAIGMVLSTVIIYIDYMKKPADLPAGEREDFQQQLLAEQKRLEHEAEQLEEYMEEYGYTPAVLSQLGALYSALAEYARWVETEARPGYLEKAAETYQALVEKEPEEVAYQFFLYSIYVELEQEVEAKEQAGIVKGLLAKKEEAGALENMERYYYAVILNEVDGNKQEALSYLEFILETEPEDTSLYLHASEYQRQLKPEDKAADQPPLFDFSPGN